MRTTSQAAIVIAGALAFSGCNLLFDIKPGESAGGSTATGSGGSGAGGSGTGGSVTCPTQKPASCDPQFTSADNCCFQGRSCGGGECTAGGECTGERIVFGNQANHNGDCISIVVAGDHLVWTTGGDSGLYRSDIDGDGKVGFDVPGDVPMEATTRIASEPGASPEMVYFTNYYGTTVGRVTIGGGDIESFAVVPDAGDQARYGNILVHGDFVYWAMQKEDAGTPGRDIWRAKRQPQGEPVVTAELVVSTENPLALADDADYLYVADRQTNTIGRVSWGALAEGASLPVTPETLVTDAAPNADAGIGEMAVDDEYLYWGSEQTLWSVPKGTPGAAPQSIGNGTSWVGVILADGRDVYFSTLGDFNKPSQVVRVSKGGVTKTQRTMFEAGLLPDNNPVQISSIAQDCDHVYVLARPECDVHRFTKCGEGAPTSYGAPRAYFVRRAFFVGEALPIGSRNVRETRGALRLAS